MLTDDSLEQNWNASSAIVVMDGGRITVVSALQLEKPFTIVILSGNSTLVRLVQFLNVSVPGDVKLSGKKSGVTEVIPLPENTLVPKLASVTESGILQDLRYEQLENAELPIEVTDSGIVIFANRVHPEKAELPIDVTVSGIVTVVIFVHLENPLSAIFTTVYSVSPSMATAGIGAEVIVLELYCTLTVLASSSSTV